MKRILFILLFIPLMSFGQTPITNDNIHSAVDLWISSQSQAESEYGHISNWDTSQVTIMNQLFANAPFNQPIENWNTSNVVNMFGMFAGAESNFNQDISNWDVSNVTNMGDMFRWNESFNQDISSWNVSNVVDFSQMFNRATSFNQPLNNWNTQSAEFMYDMFTWATAFNQPLDNWNTQNVIAMWQMFFRAESFNQPIGNWDTSNVINMQSMFAYALTFNQNLENWNFENVTNMTSMFFDSALSTSNYDKLLISWSEQNVNDNLDTVVNSNYCNGQDAREILINQNNWQIEDNGYDCSNLSIEENTLGVSIYPNPTSNYVYVNSDTELEAVVYDILGKQVMREYITDKLDISCLEKGAYIINLTDGVNTSSHKIIKN